MSECSCDPRRRRGCKAEVCENSGQYHARREVIATRILAALIARPDGTIQIHGDAVTREDETYGETLPRSAARWADCLIAVLDRE